MKVTVCELSDNKEELEEEWKTLLKHVENNESDLLLLPEMPFYPWIADEEKVDPSIWNEAVLVHEKWESMFNSLEGILICGSRPIIKDGHRFNEGFVWKQETGFSEVHKKYYLPDEPGAWEATWYERGENCFFTIVLNEISIGFLICTELWFTEHARAYAKQGIHILLCPRATFFSTVEKWILAGRIAAIMSGAYCLSSNHRGYSKHGVRFGGKGWIIEPENGNILGLTSPEQPFVTLDIDLKLADKAKKTYPRDVFE